MGQGEDGGEIKQLPNKLVLKPLLIHKDKVRFRRESDKESSGAFPSFFLSPGDGVGEIKKERNVLPLLSTHSRSHSHLLSSCVEQEVRLYTALCLSDVLRIFAPEEPYQDDETLKVRKQKSKNQHHSLQSTST